MPMNALRLPARSDHAPTNSVVAAAVSAEADTISATSDSDASNTSWMNRLKKLFSSAQATCPKNDSRMMSAHDFFVRPGRGGAAGSASMATSILSRKRNLLPSYRIPARRARVEAPRFAFSS